MLQLELFVGWHSGGFILLGRLLISVASRVGHGRLRSFGGVGRWEASSERVNGLLGMIPDAASNRLSRPNV